MEVPEAAMEAPWCYTDLIVCLQGSKEDVFQADFL